jgi:hypothetical protein
MIFPSPGWRHPFRCFWVATWNTIEIVPVPLPGWLPPRLFGKAMGKQGRRVR